MTNISLPFFFMRLMLLLLLQLLAFDFDPQLWSFANRSDSNLVICSFLGHRSPKKIWFSFLSSARSIVSFDNFCDFILPFFLCVALERIDTKKGSNFHWYLSGLSFRLETSDHKYCVLVCDCVNLRKEDIQRWDEVGRNIKNNSITSQQKKRRRWKKKEKNYDELFLLSFSVSSYYSAFLLLCMFSHLVPFFSFYFLFVRRVCWGIMSLHVLIKTPNASKYNKNKEMNIVCLFFWSLINQSWFSIFKTFQFRVDSLFIEVPQNLTLKIERALTNLQTFFEKSF